MIVSNPPSTAEDMKTYKGSYIRTLMVRWWEDGLHFYRAITSLWKDKLKENGVWRLNVE